MDKFVLVIIIMAILCVILAFLLGVIVSSDEIGIAEHRGYLKGLKEGKRREKENEVFYTEYTGDDGK